MRPLLFSARLASPMRRPQPQKHVFAMRSSLRSAPGADAMRLLELCESGGVDATPVLVDGLSGGHCAGRPDAEHRGQSMTSRSASDPPSSRIVTPELRPSPCSTIRQSALADRPGGPGKLGDDASQSGGCVPVGCPLATR